MDSLRLPSDPSLNVGPEFTAAVKKALRHARQQGLSIERVADTMSQLLRDEQLFMHHAFIQAERGIRQKDIAERFSVSPSFVAQLIRGETSSHRIARYIAQRLGRGVHDLWPNRYHNRPRKAA